ncbi:atp dependent lon protease family member [Holotrichia oblita]|nr:atp dependent lon protease family member [Holotrichia oblita]
MPAEMPDEVVAKVKKEVARLEKLSPMSPELSIVRNYIDNMLELPWKAETVDQKNLKQAREVLDADHFGMDEVKNRIIEHLAVLPGVGKTSIVESIARALGRNFVRVSLGGVKDESEIRGHRRTYIGAMPGKVIAGMKKAKTVNPVFLFDEIDKMASDHKGDPASAMLEVLDPVQNKTFTDHYVEAPYDLSRVLFICTANNESDIPWALADRLERINISSYMLVEKIKIAKQFLLPKCAVEHGLDQRKIQIPNEVLTFIIEGYTHEAGVRELSRVISQICRKIAFRIVSDEIKPADRIKLTQEEVLKMLGKEKYSKTDLDKKAVIGVVNGLSYTAAGGDVLKLEVVLTPGGKVQCLLCRLQKALRKIMELNLVAFRKNDIHIHVPGGAVPKDGPSAGVALVVALVSAFSGQKVRGDFALTGEITLSGKVLEIGGVREKVLSAYRYGIDNVIMPVQNKKSLEKVPVEVKEKLNFIFANNISDVLVVVRNLIKKPEIKNAVFETSAVDFAGVKAQTKNLPQVVFVGRKNVGKSSLINMLCNKKNLAVTSSTPGRTKLINFFRIVSEKGEFYLVDLPGYGFAAAGKSEKIGWNDNIGNYLMNAKNVRLVFVILDMRIEPTENDILCLNFLQANGIPFAIVGAKTDKLSRSAAGLHAARLGGSLGIGASDVIITSSKDKIGREKIIEKIFNNKINIFDFDGTLTTETWPKFWTWIKKFGFDGTKRNENLEKALEEYRKQKTGDFLETFFWFFNDLLVKNNESLTREELLDGEKYITYNQGVESYFKESKEKNYIISGGLVEFIKGLAISKFFDGIYGTECIFNKNDFMVGIGEIMTDDKKVLAIQDILKRNGRAQNDCSNVIFIGDGASDVASWQFVHKNGGKSVFVHQPVGKEDEWHNQLETVYQGLNEKGIIDYKCVADYRIGSDLTKILNGTAKSTNTEIIK